MKRTLIILVVGVVALGALAASGTATLFKSKKTTICHRTASAKKPYVKISVTAKELKGHQRHPADIIPAPAAGCPKQAITPTSGGTELKATLSGANEVPGPGDPDGTGSASIRAVAGVGQLCYALSVSNIMLPATAAHVHKAPAGQAGPPLVGLTPPSGTSSSATTGSSRGCVTTPRTLVADILAHPSAYYVNAHTTDYPDGAVRGQLSA